MAGFDLSITLEGEQQLHRRLMIVTTGITDFSSPLKKIGSELQKTFQDNFAQDGGLFGGWQERTKDYPWPILQKTGRMRQSFVEDVNKQNIAITNTAPYFMYHQSNKPRKRLPRRVMMKIDEQRKTFIIKAFQEYIVGLTRGRTQ